MKALAQQLVGRRQCAACLQVEPRVTFTSDQAPYCDDCDQSGACRYAVLWRALAEPCDPCTS